ncbi:MULTISPECIES: hypothetical protein [Bacillaceae]|jgi:hypothetical protein|uniref:DUF4359 domain-containing protein n=1 Tax=Gottfriedia luciferensis TaxID=178774 RepID=A0ABX2ZQE7_9BACI|nr:MULTISPECIES: hypothetical protein [Bacillaceae]ODG91436.1 hypothetical protein BED47_07200 [Gottfriedia luciferensis]PGZ92100.1 hypothetical protein COE53_12085 [Bacillus sp. AFS029533]SFC93168.1 hypothetical protein SAMN02799633_02026 [Bacillus sp. UNCCL81]
MKKLLVIGVLAICLIISAQTNPSKGEFVTWAKDQLKLESKNKYLDFGIDLLGEKLISKVTTKKDYVFFSVYEVKALDKDIKVVGLFNHFIPISKK